MRHHPVCSANDRAAVDVRGRTSLRLPSRHSKRPRGRQAQLRACAGGPGPEPECPRCPAARVRNGSAGRRRRTDPGTVLLPGPAAARKKYPETVPERHQSAFEQRRVALDSGEDGMSWLSAFLPAPEAQQIYTALSTAARGEQTAGDPRTRDQLRADILTQLLMGGRSGNTLGAVARTAGAGVTGADDLDRGDAGALPRAEIMVLINAETLFGADEQPAELHGYGPISAEAARRLARSATRWTGLVRNPRTGEILGVGRRRKVPAGLARWLRARDGTCRFPGCRVSTASTEIDHTTDWAHGGNTDHGNLAHLCRRHHRFKTLGYWKACQPVPGVLEWTSPTGRVYRTKPFLELANPVVSAPSSTPSSSSARSSLSPLLHHRIKRLSPNRTTPTLRSKGRQ
ncbi:DUF222 domain-containing protein [Arthrobacter sp. ATA002]|uniref:DUF222 domain-containing protein n=1 Tax=Arthrobacter sp. ATA002 TaxID=2991715 RepID=UPI0022A6E484|nr:DUF222 domain-containing protein [Arthrobacter sp. ATA002]WAP51816.1 DUF222 domain-containing protein [Arthrobacter sp. ATA002]